jgi:hypothetical protein
MYKKLLLLLIFISSASLLYAQDNGGVNINVTAVVNGTIETITIQTIDFQGVERESSLINIDPVTSPRAGKLIARGAPNSDFQIDFVRQRELSNTEGTGILVFNYQISGNTIDEQDTSELLDQEIRDLTFNEEGEFFIWVGGNVDVGEVQPGSYEGEFTIEIEYI